ncbi:DUF2268 domain-containing protein [Niabella beijingensis]|uniref:DUF2268 domain-containing protein n=1 Tax=Niabella beijingensis TaxID=2872700 RepID=UPI001CBB9A6A|nr:DUF2268 domain-containing protein [Niabella beijingensis]MBZ4191703.1 DUF2268 domain-containing protein [Niabella beijingensis]
MKKAFTVLLILAATGVYSQPANKVFTADIDHFWMAFDSIRQTSDYSKKLYFINKLYIEKGTEGLKAFMKIENYSDTGYVELIDKYPRFWNAIRPHTLAIKNKTAALNKGVETLKGLYPDLKDANMYFTIGALQAGGTTLDNRVLVGAEIATGTPGIDVSEFNNDWQWLKNTFAKQSVEDILYFNIHEYIHTQQKANNSYQLLNKAIKEGACDFMAELVLGQPLQRPYMLYGNLHRAKIKEQFKKDMFLGYDANWLYNGAQKGDTADLGYFIGYEICKSYYQQATDKKRAIKDIIELDYSNNKAVELFLAQSKFYKNVNKKKLIQEYEKKLPRVVKIEPFKNGAANVDPKVTELRITFSKEMIPVNYSFDYPEKGKDYFPIKKVTGFENNDRTCVVSVELLPGKEYGFIITNKSFRSKDGYPLKAEKYPVKFRTR